MTHKETLKLALEALEKHGDAYLGHFDEYQFAITKVKEALAVDKESLTTEAQPAVSETHKQSTECGGPVALYANIPTFYVRDVNGAYIEDNPLNYYTTPPQRKPMTDEQILAIYGNDMMNYRDGDYMRFARAIEAAHGIKE